MRVQEVLIGGRRFRLTKLHANGAAQVLAVLPLVASGDAEVLYWFNSHQNDIAAGAFPKGDLRLIFWGARWSLDAVAPVAADSGAHWCLFRGGNVVGWEQRHSSDDGRFGDNDVFVEPLAD